MMMMMIIIIIIIMTPASKTRDLRRIKNNGVVIM